MLTRPISPAEAKAIAATFAKYLREEMGENEVTVGNLPDLLGMAVEAVLAPRPKPATDWASVLVAAPVRQLR